MGQIQLLLDPRTGVVVATPDLELEARLGPASAGACASPPDSTLQSDLGPMPPPPPGAIPVRIARIYHGSYGDGPGRRSVVLFQGCPIRCHGFISSMLSAISFQCCDKVEVSNCGNHSGSALEQTWLGGGATLGRRFLRDLAVVRSANTVRAYRGDLAHWIAFCAGAGVAPFAAHPRTAIEFIRSERERACGEAKTVSPRTIVRRLSAVRQWYDYLALEPEGTGVRRNPIPAGNALRTGAGAIAGKPALLRYDRPLPETLSAEEMDRFIACLTATCYRDRAIVWLLKDGGLRIGEVLGLRLGDINWSKRLLTVRASKTRTERVVPVSQDAITILADYVRLERPKVLTHDRVFVNLGRRGYGQPFTYRSWAAICEQARRAADTRACTPTPSGTPTHQHGRERDAARYAAARPGATSTWTRWRSTTTCGMAGYAASSRRQWPFRKPPGTWARSPDRGTRDDGHHEAVDAHRA